MRAVRLAARAVLGGICALYVVGSDGVMDKFGIAGYLAIGGCLIAAWVLLKMEKSMDELDAEKPVHRYRGRR